MSKTYDSQTLVIPYGGQSHLTVVFRAEKSGDVLHATTGECSGSVSFANGRIAATRHPESGDWLVAIPATRIKTLYATLYAAAVGEVTRDTVPDRPDAAAFLYDMHSGASFSDVVPLRNGRVLVE